MGPPPGFFPATARHTCTHTEERGPNQHVRMCIRACGLSGSAKDDCLCRSMPMCVCVCVCVHKVGGRMACSSSLLLPKKCTNKLCTLSITRPFRHALQGGTAHSVTFVQHTGVNFVQHTGVTVAQTPTFAQLHGQPSEQLLMFAPPLLPLFLGQTCHQPAGAGGGP